MLDLTIRGHYQQMCHLSINILLYSTYHKSQPIPYKYATRLLFGLQSIHVYPTNNLCFSVTNICIIMWYQRVSQTQLTLAIFSVGSSSHIPLLLLRYTQHLLLNLVDLPASSSSGDVVPFPPTTYHVLPSSDQLSLIRQPVTPWCTARWYLLSLIHIWRCRRIERCRSRWSPYH